MVPPFFARQSIALPRSWAWGQMLRDLTGQLAQLMDSCRYTDVIYP